MTVDTGRDQRGTSPQAPFASWSRPRQAWEGAGGPLLAGALCGVALHVDLWLYLGLVVLSVLGGLPSGRQHRTWCGAAARAVLGGAVWASAVLLVSALATRSPVVAFPDPSAWFLMYGIVPSLAVASIVWGRAHARP